MTHGKDYREGRITLKRYRYLQGLSLAASQGSVKAKRKYEREERK